MHFTTERLEKLQRSLELALNQEWPQLSGTQARLARLREKDAREWLEARKEEIKLLLAEAPDSVPGYGLRNGRTVETVTNPEEVYRRFRNGIGGTPEAFLKCIKVVKTALKNQVRGLSGRKGRELEAIFESLLAGCVEFKTSAPTIEKLT